MVLLVEPQCRDVPNGYMQGIERCDHYFRLADPSEPIGSQPAHNALIP